VWFGDLNEIGDIYEISTRKPRIRHIRRPFQIGIAVYQLAKLRMLEFHYDFIDRFVDRRDYELIQMDTDSLYFALSGNSLEDVGVGEEICRHEDWLSCSKRTPGLFNLEFEGKKRVIALCSKCYIVDGETNAEGIWQQYKAALLSGDAAESNRTTLGLSAYYDKRRVLPDGIHTEPLEYGELE